MSKFDQIATEAPALDASLDAVLNVDLRLLEDLDPGRSHEMDVR